MKQTENVALSSFLQIFTDTLHSLEGSTNDDNKLYAISRQHNRARKRAKLDNPATANTAIQDFVIYNDLARAVRVDLAPEILNEARWFIENALCGFTSQQKFAIQEPLDMNLFLSLWRYGPGASRGTKSTHFVDKINDKVHTVSDASVARLYRMALSLDPYVRGSIACNSGPEFRFCDTSSISTVSKNEDTDRTICTEPLGNMALQLAAGMYIEGALRYVGCDISIQASLNKQLAMLGSIFGLLSTIDLSHASDMITLQLVSVLWPRGWTWLFNLLRSKKTKLPSGEVIELNMLSTMGNGFTFPMMTLTLLSLVYANARVNGGPRYLNKDTHAVFGDDIIVPSTESESLLHVLKGAGLIVNNDKSYTSGPFRESCGGDYYKGYDVTPVYVKSLNNDSEIYVAINQLLKWSSKHKIMLYQPLDFLIKLLKGQVLLVPEWEDTSSGILTLSCSRRYKYLKRKPYIKNRKDSKYIMSCVLGGYGYSASEGISYNLRQNLKKATNDDYYVVKARLPKGYLDGYCPTYRTMEEAAFSDRQLGIIRG
jgi:hypothetical protein